MSAYALYFKGQMTLLLTRKVPKSLNGINFIEKLFTKWKLFIPWIESEKNKKYVKQKVLCSHFPITIVEAYSSEVYSLMSMSQSSTFSMAARVMPSANKMKDTEPLP